MEVSALTHPSSIAGPARAVAAAAPAVRRAPDRAHPPRPARRLRGALLALPVAPAVLLPAHARLARGRRGRPAGGLRRRLQRGPRRRARDQRAPVAVPHRAQPLAQPPAPRLRHRRRLDGRPLRRGRHLHRRQGHAPRELPRAASPTSTSCPRPSAPRCCCARSTRSPTSRSRTPWRPPCRPSSRCSCAPASRSPRQPRRASSAATRSASSSARSPRASPS